MNNLEPMYLLDFSLWKHLVFCNQKSISDGFVPSNLEIECHADRSVFFTRNLPIFPLKTHILQCPMEISHLFFTYLRNRMSYKAALGLELKIISCSFIIWIDLENEQKDLAQKKHIM